MAALDTIPTLEGEIARFLISDTEGSGDWYDERGDPDQGTVTGDAEIVENLVVGTVRYRHAQSGSNRAQRLWLRRTSGSTYGYNEWLTGGDVDAGTRIYRDTTAFDALDPFNVYSVYFAFNDSATVHEVPFQNLWPSGSPGTGGVWANLDVPDASANAFNGVGSDSTVNVVVAVRSTFNADLPATSFRAGSPTLNAEPDSTSGDAVVDADLPATEFRAGNPTLNAAPDLSPVENADLPTTAFRAGSPTFEAAPDIGDVLDADLPATEFRAGSPTFEAQPNVMGVLPLDLPATTFRAGNPTFEATPDLGDVLNADIAATEFRAGIPTLAADPDVVPLSEVLNSDVPPTLFRAGTPTLSAAPDTTHGTVTQRRLDALMAVTLLLRESVVIQLALGTNDEDEATRRIQGVAPVQGHSVPWVWTEDLGGEPIDRAMGLSWSIKKTSVAIHCIADTAESMGSLIDAVEETLDGVTKRDIAFSGWTPIHVFYITVGTPGDERLEDEQDGIARSVVATVVTRKNY